MMPAARPTEDYPHAMMQDLYPEEPLTWEDAREFKALVMRLRAKAAWRMERGMHAKAVGPSEAADKLQVILDTQIIPRIRGDFDDSRTPTHLPPRV